MTQSILAVLTLAAVALAVYHHAVYPLILKRPAGRPGAAEPAVPDGPPPTVTLLIPAYNEAAFIADKIRNLAQLDYPSDRLRVVIACDGCSDPTVRAAKEAGREPECAGLNLEVIDFPENRGKVAVLNETIPTLDGDLVALSDVSALISVDALRVAAARFGDPAVGVVAGAYRILDPASPGEETYWRYQSAVKLGEAALGAPIGVHGAFYMFRRDLFTPLPADTINDDFVLPMEIVAGGRRAVYDPAILALELERAAPDTELRRRRRIAAGNLQQVLRLYRLLHPRFGGVALAFASGKALRAFMPFVLMFALLGSLALAPASVPFALLALGQLFVYIPAALLHLFPRLPAPRPLRTLHYLVSGHVAGLIGAWRYMTGKERGRWKRA